MPPDCGPKEVPFTNSSTEATATLSEASTSTASGRPLKARLPSPGKRKPTRGGCVSFETGSVRVALAVSCALLVATAFRTSCVPAAPLRVWKMNGERTTTPALTLFANSSTLCTATSSFAETSTSSEVWAMTVAPSSGRAKATVGGRVACVCSVICGA